MRDSCPSSGMRFLRTVLLALLSVFQLTACTAQYPLNPKADTIDSEKQYRMKLADRNRDDELLLVLAFSGGGTRAAALSYGILEALDLVQVPPPRSGIEQRHTLLDEVDLISSVSGGSFTASYYGLYGRRIFNDFLPDFLYADHQSALFWDFMNPVNWIFLSSPRFGRSDLAQEYYDGKLFNGATLGDFKKRPGPVIVILATEAGDGVNFTFTPGQFALICSDFDKFPVSRAVAASAAFPGAFSPVLLKNYSGDCNVQMPKWMAEALAKPDISSRAYHNARRMKTYLDSKRKPYIHLIDGGVSDNLGVRNILESLIARGGIRESMREANLENTRRIAIIIVDAQIQEAAHWQALDEVPGLGTIIGASSTILINKYNFETIELLNHLARDWSLNDKAQGLEPINFYIVHVSFDALSDQKDRDYFNDIPTSLYLPGEQVDRLRQAASEILYNNKQFQKLVTDLGGIMPYTNGTLKERGVRQEAKTGEPQEEELAP